MVTMQERQVRKTLHELRLEILGRQTKICKQYCDKCPLREKSTLATCKNCPAAALLAACGEDLIEVSNIIRAERKVEIVELAKEFGLNETICKKLEDLGCTQKEIASIVGVSVDVLRKWYHKNIVNKIQQNGLTVDEYYRLSSKMSDARVANELGIEDHQLAAWKKRQGIKNNKLKRKAVNYRLYINDELIAEGALLEISKQTNLKISTLQSYRSKQFKIRQQTRKRKVKLVKEGEAGW